MPLLKPKRRNSIALITVSSVSEKRKGWSVVTGHEGGAWLLPDRVLRRLKLSEGRDIDTVELDALVSREQPAPARRDAVRYLSHSERTVAQLRSYLLGRGYDPTVAGEVAGWAEEHGFVSDSRYAELFVRSRTVNKPMGRSRIAAELRKRGIPSGEAEKALAERQDEDLFEELVVEVRKKYGSLDRETAFRRGAAWLGRRGFQGGLSFRVLNAALSAGEEESR